MVHYVQGQTRDLTIRDGFLMVALVWTVLPAFAALPLIIQFDASFTDAYFEAVSGLTTTGATVFRSRQNAAIDQLLAYPAHLGGRHGA